MSLGITEPKVLLMRGRGAISWAIRLQTRAPYSHTALQRRDGRIIEAWAGANRVRIARLESWEDVDAYTVPSMSPKQWDTALSWATQKAINNCRYDYRSVLRFLTRRQPSKNDRWLCSELVFAALQVAGVDLLHRIPAAAVSPGLLALSPLLEPLPGYRGEVAG